MPNKYIAQHWHFYQPRNNDFWAGIVDSECYKPNSQNGILDNITYNLGPTLIDWLEKHDSKTLDRMLKADKGQVLAQTYNHRIMPLIRYDEDLKTQIVWGKKHFSKYFNRDPKGIWLPETATDKRVCRELVNQGIDYTVGSWWQGTELDGSPINTRSPYNIDLGDGKKIVYFFFDPISSQIAFNSVASNSTRFLENADVALDRILRDRPDGGLTLLAYDAETFGHHHKFADRWAEYFPKAVAKREDAELVTIDEYVKLNPPKKYGKIVENSSWSCLCGNLERWTTGCSCSGGMRDYQELLLEVLEHQEDEIHNIYVSECESVFQDIWDARNDYIDVKLNMMSFEDFLNLHSKTKLSESKKNKVLDLLDAEYFNQLSFTSCGWFFPDFNIQTMNNIGDARLATEKIRSATSIDLSDNFDPLEKMCDNYNSIK